MMERAAARTIRTLAHALALRRLTVRVSGVEHVPRSGAVLLAVRHFHHFLDGLALLEATPRRLHILVALDWVRGRALRAFMEWATRAARWPMFLRPEAPAFGLDGSPAHCRSAFSAREIGAYRRRSLRDAVEVLVGGGALVVFPEGYPNIDPHFTPKGKPDEMLPFRSGFATIASIAERRLGERIPIVPTGLSYTLGRRWTAHVHFGRPVYLASCDSRRALVRLVERRVQELSDLRIAAL